MNNNISFTGINNIYIGKNATSQMGSFISKSGDVKHGFRETLYTKLKCTLCDNELGKDLSEFRESLNRRKCFQTKSVADTDTTNFELIIKRNHITDSDEQVSESDFFLNGIGIKPNERNMMPLFTYLAKITRTLRLSPQMSESQKECLGVMNQSIAEEAMRFIDNMY